MVHKLGMHWLCYHQEGRDFEHIEQMQYRSIKPFQWMWNNSGFCADLLTVLPGDSYILARDHPLSEQKDDMWRDPVGAGVRHANEWAEKVRSRQYHLPTDRSFFLGINEPDATNGDRSAIDRYNESYLTRLQQHGLRGGAFSFSTGHPRTADGTPNTPADYSVFESTRAAIVRGHHIAVAHIYGTTAVPLAPGHYDRLAACPWTDVEWVIGEFGIDEHVIGGGPHVGFHSGFEGRLHEYCAWLDAAIMGIEAIFPYIHSYETFTFDFSHPWDSFDVRAIREALEAYDWQHAKQGNVTKSDSKPCEVNLPSIPNGKPIATVNVPDGANIRIGPGLNHRVRGAEPLGTVMQIVGRDATGQWWYINLPHTEGWVSATVVDARNANNVPVRDDVLEPVSIPEFPDNWQRVIAWILDQEGGYTPNDEGAPANFGINQGANPDLDVKSITRDQAIERYRTKYWQGSGADKQPWPLCLLVMNAAVQSGEAMAAQWLAQAGGNPWLFQGLFQRFYAQINQDSWARNGRAWMRRCGDVLMEASKNG